MYVSIEFTRGEGKGGHLIAGPMKVLPAAEVCTKVLKYWFRSGPPYDMMGLWFGSSKAIDQEIKEGFELMVEALAGNVDCLRDDLTANPRGALTAVLLLDQFPRNIYRGTGRMFQYDQVALGITKEAIRRGYDRAIGEIPELGPVAQSFMYLPFEHSESWEDQKESVRLFAALAEAYPSQSIVSSFLAYARSHEAIVGRFGRFPHRNALLGRESTPEEEAYLQGGGETFGTKPKDDL